MTELHFPGTLDFADLFQYFQHMKMRSREIPSGPSLFHRTSAFRFGMVAPVYFAFLVLIVFGKGMIFGNGWIFSAYRHDLNLMTVPFLRFGFGQMAQGNLALWNPHSLCGTPFMGNFQSALLYPFNWLHLILPTWLAINWSVGIHFFLAGWFTSLWCRRRGLGTIACLLGGTTFMFCAGYFVRLFAGNVQCLNAMTWTPLILLVVDAVCDRPTLQWILCGIAAVALSIFAGHPQTAYYTALIVGIYVTMRLLLEAMPQPWRKFGIAASVLSVVVLVGQSMAEKLSEEHAPWFLISLIPLGILLFARFVTQVGQAWRVWLRVAGALAAIYIGGAMIGAIQLGPGRDAAEESSRADGVTREFACDGTLPPEGLFTLFSPHFFGSPKDGILPNPRTDADRAYVSRKRVPNIARGGFWEVTLFAGVTPLLLAGLGAFRNRRFAATLAGITIILAMGHYAGPLFDPMFQHLPGYKFHRIHGRYNFLFGLFTAMLAACGWDALSQPGSNRRRMYWAAGSLVAGLVVLLTGVWIAGNSENPTESFWGRFFIDLLRRKDLNNLEELIIRRSRYAGQSLMIGAATLLAGAGCILATRRNLRWRYGVAALLVAEMLVFALVDCPMTNVELEYPRLWEEAVVKRPAGSRVFTDARHYANWGLLRGWNDIYGYDSILLKRYSDVVAVALGYDPDEQNFVPPGRPANPGIDYPPPTFRMLRMGVVCTTVPEQIGIKAAVKKRMVRKRLPHVLLVHRAAVVPDRKQRLEVLVDPRFDPSQIVILEESPSVPPDEMGGGGSAKIVKEGTDELEIEVQLPSAAILLVTDSYSKDWHARELNSGVSYKVLPANHMLRAVALPAGNHHILMEYRPKGFVVGRVITLASLSGYLVIAAWAVWRWRRSRSV